MWVPSWPQSSGGSSAASRLTKLPVRFDRPPHSNLLLYAPTLRRENGSVETIPHPACSFHGTHPMSSSVTEELLHKKCGPCEGGVPPLSGAEARSWLQGTPRWSIQGEGRRLRRDWVAKNFLAAIDFFDRVALLAEE